MKHHATMMKTAAMTVPGCAVPKDAITGQHAPTKLLSQRIVPILSINLSHRWIKVTPTDHQAIILTKILSTRSRASFMKTVLKWLQLPFSLTSSTTSSARHQLPRLRSYQQPLAHAIASWSSKCSTPFGCHRQLSTSLLSKKRPLRWTELLQTSNLLYLNKIY